MASVTSLIRREGGFRKKKSFFFLMKRLLDNRYEKSKQICQSDRRFRSRVKSGEWDGSVNGTLRHKSYKIKDKGDIFFDFI